MFDPNQFLDMQVTDANSTSSTPVPEGEYMAIVDDVKPRQWTKKDDPSVSGIALDVDWLIDDENVKKLLERDKVIGKQGLMLDLNASGGLDTGKGKNVGLGRLRDAVGLNTPGQPFSFSMLKGRMAKVQIKHRVAGDQIFAEVKAVLKV